MHTDVTHATKFAPAFVPEDGEGGCWITPDGGVCHVNACQHYSTAFDTFGSRPCVLIERGAVRVSLDRYCGSVSFEFSASRVTLPALRQARRTFAAITRDPQLVCRHPDGLYTSASDTDAEWDSGYRPAENLTQAFFTAHIARRTADAA